MASLTRRLDYIDFMKGIGIIIVVWGHTNPLFSKWIYAFHMPLFAFLSGVFAYKITTLKETIEKKSKSLLIPFFFFSVTWWVITLLILKLDDSHSLPSASNKIFYILGGSGQNSIRELSNVTVWFLPYLFTTFIIHWLNLKGPNPKFGAVSLGVCGVLVGYTGISLPYSFDTALTLYPFFYIGSLYIKNIKHEKFNAAYIPLSVIVFLISTYFNDNVDTAANIIGNPLLFYVSAFSAISCILMASIRIGSVRLINLMGEKSLDILIFHMIFIKLIVYFDITDSSLIIFLGSIIFSLLVGMAIKKFVPQLYGEFRAPSFGT